MSSNEELEVQGTGAGRHLSDVLKAHAGEGGRQSHRVALQPVLALSSSWTQGVICEAAPAPGGCKTGAGAVKGVPATVGARLTKHVYVQVLSHQWPPLHKPDTLGQGLAATCAHLSSTASHIEPSVPHQLSQLPRTFPTPHPSSVHQLTFPLC